jgi:hypothetical protein
VQPGDTVILPFDLPSDPSSDSTLHFDEKEGFLIIEDHGATVLLQGYFEAMADYWQNPVVVEDAHRVPVDVAVWLAFTDPNPDISQ